MPPVAPDMAAGTPEGAMEMSGGGESAGMGAMEGAFAPDTAAPAAAPDAAEFCDGSSHGSRCSCTRYPTSYG